jgi:large subunit ribosomal protein L32
MAVPKKRTSKSKKGSRRAHDHILLPTPILCACGEATLPHRICPSCGTYKGRQMLKVAADAAAE